MTLWHEIASDNVATYLLDTSALSFLFKEDTKVRARIASLAPEDRVVICTVVRGEVLYGIERMPRSKRQRDIQMKAMNLFAAIPCEHVSEAAADHYARLKREAERKGTPLDENDLWIAATASAIGATLVTTDSDFLRLSGLRLEDWTL